MWLFTAKALKAEDYIYFRLPLFFFFFLNMFTLSDVDRSADDNGLIFLQVTGELCWGLWCLNFWQQSDQSSCPYATVPGTSYYEVCVLYITMNHSRIWLHDERGHLFPTPLSVVKALIFKLHLDLCLSVCVCACVFGPVASRPCVTGQGGAGIGV